jgi:hypothetical protein
MEFWHTKYGGTICDGNQALILLSVNGQTLKSVEYIIIFLAFFGTFNKHIAGRALELVFYHISHHVYLLLRGGEVDGILNRYGFITFYVNLVLVLLATLLGGFRFYGRFSTYHYIGVDDCLILFALVGIFTPIT